MHLYTLKINSEQSDHYKSTALKDTLKVQCNAMKSVKILKDTSEEYWFNFMLPPHTLYFLGGCHQRFPPSVLPCVVVVVHVDVSQSSLAQAGGLLKLLDGRRMETTARQVHWPTSTLNKHRHSRSGCMFSEWPLGGAIQTLHATDTLGTRHKYLYSHVFILLIWTCSDAYIKQYLNRVRKKKLYLHAK